MTRDWDARTYDRVADPQTRWGTAVLERLPLDGDERVLDAGLRERARHRAAGEPPAAMGAWSPSMARRR